MLAAVATPAYKAYIAKVKIHSVYDRIQDIIHRGVIYHAQTGDWPYTLSLIGMDDLIGSTTLKNGRFAFNNNIQSIFGNAVVESNGSGTNQVWIDNNDQCNYMYIYLPLDRSVLGSDFSSSAYIEVEVGANIINGDIKFSCGLFKDGLSSEANYFPCEYNNYSDLESATGGNICP